MNKIQQFIKDNNIDLTGSGSSLNGECVILAGYALYLNEDKYDFDKLLEDVQEDGLLDLTSEAIDELERVYSFAYKSDYDSFWKTEKAKTQYIF